MSRRGLAFVVAVGLVALVLLATVNPGRAPAPEVARARPTHASDLAVAPAPVADPAPGEALRAERGTWIVQLQVGRDAAEVLGARLKPRLPFRERPSAPGPFRLRAVDARGRTFEASLEVQGLRPEGVPASWCREDGAWVRGDEVLLPSVPVLVKLPAALTRPIELEVTRADGAVIGRGGL